MGFFGFSGFNTPGKGIDKNAPKKNRFFYFFELFPRKLMSLIKLNLFYILISLPIFLLSSFLLLIQIDVSSVGGGEWVYSPSFFGLMLIALPLLFLSPINCGYSYILRCFVREEHVWFFSDFFMHIKSNLKQSIIIGVIDAVLFGIILNALRFYPMFINESEYYIVLFVGFIIAAAIYAIMHFYIYIMMITFELKTKELIKNAFLLALYKLVPNFLIFTGFSYLLYLLYTYQPVLMAALLILVLPSAFSFVSAYYSVGVIDKIFVNNKESEGIIEETIQREES